MALTGTDLVVGVAWLFLLAVSIFLTIHLNEMERRKPSVIQHETTKELRKIMEEKNMSYPYKQIENTIQRLLPVLHYLEPKGDVDDATHNEMYCNTNDAINRLEAVQHEIKRRKTNYEKLNEALDKEDNEKAVRIIRRKIIELTTLQKDILLKEYNKGNLHWTAEEPAMEERTE